MTIETIVWNKLTPREKDVLVAEKIHGEAVEYDKAGSAFRGGYYQNGEFRGLSPVPGYTHRIEEAYGALRAVKDYSWHLGIDYDGDAEELSGWAGDSNCHHPKRYDPEDTHGFSHIEEMIVRSVPEAMCVLALRAVGVPIDTLTASSWEEADWQQCPWCGSLSLVKGTRPLHDIEKCVMNRETHP